MEKIVRKFIGDNLDNIVLLYNSPDIFNLNIYDFLYCYYSRDKYLIESEVGWWGDNTYSVKCRITKELIIQIKPTNGWEIIVPNLYTETVTAQTYNLNSELVFNNLYVSLDSYQNGDVNEIKPIGTNDMFNLG